MKASIQHLFSLKIIHECSNTEKYYYCIRILGRIENNITATESDKDKLVRFSHAWLHLRPCLFSMSKST